MSEREITASDVDHDLQQPDDDKIKKVAVTVDNKKHRVRPGIYVVADFKRLVRVTPEYELEQLINGRLAPLADDARVEVLGGEVFISHARQGGSS